MGKISLFIKKTYIENRWKLLKISIIDPTKCKQPKEEIATACKIK